MSPVDVLAMVKNLEQRTSAVEQILPTLATKEDLKAFATKEDLKAFATKEDLKAFATKEDLKEALKPYAPRAEMEDTFEETESPSPSCRNPRRTFVGVRFERPRLAARTALHSGVASWTHG